MLHEHSPHVHHCVFSGALQHRPGGRKGTSRVVGAVPALHSPSGHQPFPGSAVLLHWAGIILGSTVILKTTGVVFRLCHEPTRD